MVRVFVLARVLKSGSPDCTVTYATHATGDACPHQPYKFRAQVARPALAALGKAKLQSILSVRERVYT
eukprot:6718177-Prorocentrum_lima.AAC.1